MAPEPRSRDVRDDELPDPALFWRWAGKASRPVVGWVCIGVGALLILIGWFGVSREAIVAKQLPYLISGGVGGVLFAVVGAYVLGTEELRNDSGRLDRLERMVEELHGALLIHAASTEMLPPAATVEDMADYAPEEAHGTNGHGREPAASSGRLVALPGGERYHRAGCSMVEGKTGAAVLAPSSVKRRHLEPCPLCEPARV